MNRIFVLSLVLSLIVLSSSIFALDGANSSISLLYPSGWDTSPAISAINSADSVNWSGTVASNTVLYITNLYNTSRDNILTITKYSGDTVDPSVVSNTINLASGYFNAVHPSNNPRMSIELTLPIILSETIGVNGMAFSGFTVAEDTDVVTPVTLEDTIYVVPSGKTFVVLGLHIDNSNDSVSITTINGASVIIASGYFNHIHRSDNDPVARSLRQPIFVKAGESLNLTSPSAGGSEAYGYYRAN